MKRTCIAVMAVIVTACLLLVAGFSSRADAQSGGYQAGDIIEFGWYPQTVVMGGTLYYELNRQSKTWINYPYFSENTGSDADHYPSMLNESMMKYADFTYDGVKYRAVVINQYRPGASINPPESNECQSMFPFSKNTTYYFRWEPIQWVVLDPTSGLVVSLKNLDAQPFCATYYFDSSSMNHSIVNAAYRVSNFSVSTIRAWLNAYSVDFSWYGNFNFLNSAFSSSEKSIIQTSTIENVDNASLPTQDKLFLLSKDEFETYIRSIPLAENTDYSRSQGKNVTGAWFLRTPTPDSGGSTRNGGMQLYYVTSQASMSDTYMRRVSSTSTGIRPAMRLDLTSSLIRPWTRTFTITEKHDGEYPEVSWQDHELTEIRTWEVLRCDGNKDPDVASNWTVLKTINSSAAIYLNDTTAARETTYYYKVLAYSPYATYESNVVSSYGRLPAPTVTWTNNSDGKPVLSWESTGAVRYQVIKRNYSTYTTLGTTTNLTYTDSAAQAATTSYYFVRSVSAVDSKYSSPTGVFVTVPCILATPINVECVMDGTNKTIRWDAVSGAETYEVYGRAAQYGWTVGTTSGISITDKSAPKNEVVSYRVIAHTSAGEDFSSAYAWASTTWTNSAPVITEQPSNVTATVDSVAKFSVKASGTGTLQYQWQYRKNSSSVWAPSGQSGNKTATLSVTTSSGLHGYQFRCIVSDSNGAQTISGVAKLTLKPKITTWPKDTAVTVGSTATFTMAATGKAPLQYQWQYRKDASSEWKASGQSGNKTATLSVAATAGLHGYQFRCYVTDANGQKSYTNTVTLTVKPKITTQPKDTSATVGSTAQFTVAATGKGPLQYQWQYRKNETDDWKTSGQSGNKTATLSVATTAGLHGYQFRCRITDGNNQKSYTKTVTLTVKPKITTPPTDASATVGSKATFTVAATGKSELTYQWQYRKNETDDWKASGQSGNKTATLKVSVTAGLHGYQFRCRVTDGNNQKSYTKAVTLTVKPAITTQPSNKSVTAGTAAKFTVVADGKAKLTYQWQYRKNSSDTWKPSGQSGNKTATLSVAATKGLNGYQFRCVVTDGNGQKSYTNTVTLTVN